MNRPQDDARWHLDKRVPIALIVTILIQTGAAVWWAGQASERINALERSYTMTAPNSDRLTRVEVKLEVVQEGVTDIKRILQQRTRN